MTICDICNEMGCCDCSHCKFGNPCFGCVDYNEETEECNSNGGCGKDSGENR